MELKKEGIAQSKPFHWNQPCCIMYNANTQPLADYLRTVMSWYSHNVSLIPHYSPESGTRFIFFISPDCLRGIPGFITQPQYTDPLLALPVSLNVV